MYRLREKLKPIPVVAWPMLGLRVRIPRGYLSLVSVVCCQLEISATDHYLVQRSPTECVCLCVCVCVSVIERDEVQQ
jgi:hypothetical protein